LNHVKLKSWRKQIGVVPQEITLFSGSVIDNLVLGVEHNPQNVVDFCMDMGLHDVFMKFPQGYNTLLGEDGVNISGGQMQILGLARALYHKPNFLILDEATSALDRKTEDKVLRLLLQLKNELSIFFITHRAHILKEFVDTIYILENCTIAGSGTPKELLETKNLYSDYRNSYE
jgi:ATP-binding cassette subfamily B protein